MSIPLEHRASFRLFSDQPSARLDDRGIETLRVRHYSRRIEEADVHWTCRRHPFSVVTAELLPSFDVPAEICLDNLSR